MNMTEHVATFPESTMGLWVRWVSSVMVFPVFAFVIVSLISHDRRVTSIEASRYTSADAIKDQRQVAVLVSGIMSDLAALRVDMAKLPPDDFVARVNAIEERLRNVEINVAKAH